MFEMSYLDFTDILKILNKYQSNKNGSKFMRTFKKNYFINIIDISNNIHIKINFIIDFSPSNFTDFLVTFHLTNYR